MSRAGAFAAISSIVRPVLTLVGKVSAWTPALASLSRSLIRSHCGCLAGFFVRTRTQRPLRRSPSMLNLSSPLLSALAGSPLAGLQRPRSQTMTLPPPYSPSGMLPSKSP